ncbi:MAG: RICIN domain-containing protein [Actinomycetota bacterium]
MSLFSRLHELCPRPPWAARRGAQRRGADRGATLSEYALIVSVVVTATIAVIALVEDQSGSYLVESGSSIGEPRGLAADYGLADPVSPPWLTQPPPPTTTTSTTTTTTTPALGDQLQPRHSGLCLAVAGGLTAPGSPVVQETCDGSLSQRWLLTDLGNGFWEVQAEHSNLCLDVAGRSTG